MVISQGIYRGCKIEFGIIPGTSGQAHVTVEALGKGLQSVIDTITEELLRKTFNFPETNGTNFNLYFERSEHNISWSFFIETIGRCTQYEYLSSIFKSIDALCTYIPPKKEEDKADDVPVAPEA